MINWKEVYPKMKSIKEYFVERCSNTFWKCGEEVNTLRMQQGWRRRFAVLYFGNKIEKLAGFA